jgi:DNA-binding LytR/AlgR family response regulator
MKTENNPPALLHIGQMDGIHHFEPEQIVRVEALNNYCKIHFINQERALVVSKVLSWVEKNLPPEMFIRVHRSRLVNKNYVEKSKNAKAGVIHLITCESIPVSRRKRSTCIEF